MNPVRACDYTGIFARLAWVFQSLPSDNKRDQIIAFYGALLVLLFRSWTSTTSFSPGEPAHYSSIEQLWRIVCVVFGLLGFVISLILIMFRKWHIVYVNTAIVVQSLAAKSLPFESSQVENEWKKLNKEDNCLGMNILSVERLTLIGFALISFIPFYLLMTSLDVTIWMILAYHIFYMFILELVHACFLKSELDKGYKASWLLKGIP